MQVQPSLSVANIHIVQYISASQAASTQAHYDTLESLLSLAEEALNVKIPVSTIWSLIANASGMGNIPGKITTTSQRITKYQTYLPTGRKTVTITL